MCPGETRTRYRWAIAVSSTALIALSLALVASGGLSGGSRSAAVATARSNDGLSHCVAFGPFLGTLDPDNGPHPSPELLDSLLDVVASQTRFRCTMTYGVLHGLDHVFPCAAQRGLKVVAIVWLSTDEETNTQSIAAGIRVAKTFPDTIVRLSCGSELRAWLAPASADAATLPKLDGIARNCLTELRAAGVAQPLTAIDTWWEWCARAWPCQKRDLANDVDWIGINVFPWWENRYSGLFPCTPAASAADFTIARLQDVVARYPGQEARLVEFGWPGGPAGYFETNERTGDKCGVASEDNQRLVIEQTVTKLDQLGQPGILFEAFRGGESKVRKEGPVGSFWGICEGTPVYTCKSVPALPPTSTATAPPTATGTAIPRSTATATATATCPPAPTALPAIPTLLPTNTSLTRALGLPIVENAVCTG